MAERREERPEERRLVRAGLSASAPGVVLVRVLLLVFFLVLFRGAGGAADDEKGGAVMEFSLVSAGFQHQGEIPTQYTGYGRDVSPPLAWSGPPAGTKSLALIVDDPDAPDPKAPAMVWVHWVLYNIPPTASGLPEAVRKADLPAGTLEGKNDWKVAGYRGPKPPIGRHRYFHKLYALDTVLADLGSPTKARLEQAMEGHVLGKAELVGTYPAPK